MNIIIITDALTKPLYTIRVRFLNRQLLAEGHTVTWYTERHHDIPDEVRPENLIEIPYYKESKLDHAVKGTLSVLVDHKNRYFAREILKRIITNQITPDIIFVSTFHTFGLRAGLALAQHFDCALHTDFRDIAEQTLTNAYSRSFLSHNNFYRNISIRRRNAVLRKATVVTSVSEFHRNFLSEINHNSHVIYNGYDSNIFHPATENIERNETPSKEKPIRIIYTGRWYGEDLENPVYLFRALSHHPEIQLVFYTAPDVHERLRRLAEQYDINLEVHPYVRNSEVPALLHHTDFALMLTAHGNRGCLSTKLFEAMGSSVPVICTPSDKGELVELVKRTEAGLVSSDPEEILAYVMSKHERREKDNSFFSRQTQTTIMIKLMHENIKRQV